MINEKKCSRCQTIKSIDLFSKDAYRKTGFSNNCKECRKEYNLKNKDRNNKVCREWHEKNKDKANARRKQWNLDNYEKAKLKDKNYAKNNPEILRNKANLRRARVLSNGIYEINKKELKKLYAQNCFYCESNEKIQLDHVIPISKGGSHSIGNIVPACRKCNLEKSDKFIAEWKLRKA